ncbi:TetR/AcrR family transcriptional regulator [Sphingomonas fuzhouensis]|uniref:TetR/AcrR family transcriptional regulator n=1 Tax=Sphingomonas fuzhouensis TaxID=3106033 RepID=UPI002AFF89EF|nr:TetR/AcrR family transcriptional regulator [Sphingomonas sp. SGZ-02]
MTMIASTPDIRRQRGRPRKDEGPSPRHILDAAVTAFARHGWEGTHLRQVAEAAGVDTALIARRYDGKMGLWQAIVDDVSRRLEEMFTASAIAADAGPQDRLAVTVEAFVRLNLALPDLGRFFIDQVSRPGLRRDYVIARMWRVYRDAMLPVVAAARGRERSGSDPELYIGLLLGAVAMPLMMRSVTLDDLDDPTRREAFVQNVLALFVRD